MSVTTSIDLKADASAVWAVLSELGNLGAWVSNHAGYVGGAPQSPTPGTEYIERIRVMGMPSDVAWTISDLEEGRRIAQRGRGPMGIGIDAEYLIERTEDGSRFTVSQSFFGAALFAVKSQLEREVKAAQESSLNRLRELVETS
jgi:hypothetical protein